MMGGDASAGMGGGAFNVGALGFATMGGVLDDLACSVTMDGGALTLAAMGCIPDALVASNGRPLPASAMVKCGLRWSSPTRGDAILLTLLDPERRSRS